MRHDLNEGITVTEQPQPVSRSVPLSSLRLDHPHWVNPRSIIDEGELTELEISVKERGILVPLHVAKIIEDGDIVNLVLDGQRRVLVAQRTLPHDIEVPVIDAISDVIDELTWDRSDELLTLALDIGNRRKGLSSYELAETGERLKNRGKSNVEISRALNKSETWVSRMLKARLTASPTLMRAWRLGEVTDEQFKELATEKDQDAQADAATEVIAARKENKGEARALAKERVTRAANTEKKGERKARSSAKGDAAPKQKAAPSKLVLEEMLGFAETRPPTHDYVRGLMDGVAYALGIRDPEEFSSPWRTYLARIGGSTSSSGPTKRAKAGRPKGAKGR